MPSPPPQPVPQRNINRSVSNTSNLAAPSSSRTGASPMSYGAMTGISFTNGGGFSFENQPRSIKWGGAMGSYGAKFYGDAGGDSPTIPFSSSITMEPSSFAASASAFGLPSSSMSSSWTRRSYAAAVSGRGDASHGLSNSFASMSFQPMSFGTSYSKSKVHSLMAKPRSDAELTKAYECCGSTHEGLHELLEHVEDCHPFSDPNIPPDGGFSPVTNAMDLDLDDVEETLPEGAAGPSKSARASISPVPVPSYPLPTSSSKATTPTEQASIGKSPLKLSDVLKSPPDADITVRPSNLTLNRPGSTGSSPPEGSLATPTTSTQPSPVFAQPRVNPSARSNFLGSSGIGAHPDAQQKRFDRAFNEVVAGAKGEEIAKTGDKEAAPTAVAPGVLFASAVSSLGIPTVPPGQKAPPASTQDGEAGALADLPMPQPSLFSSHRPWRCPNPGCNKSYKQSNGLKYHQMKGQCDFAIHDAVDLGLSVEEAEERNRPFVCAVGAGCNKRYRQMNGLKYHYLNSGEHGQYGLRMLQNGTHPHPPSVPTIPETPSASGSTAVNKPRAIPTSTNGNSTRPAPGKPYAIPSQAAKTGAAVPQGRTAGVGGQTHGHAHPMPRMGTWPSQKPGAAGSAARPIPAKASIPPVVQPQAVQKGRDAVLFATSSTDDPLDVLGRMDQ